MLSRHFLFYFEILTSLSFQVSCSSSCVKCLIVFSDSQSVSTCSPWLLLCSNSLVPVLCQCVVTCHVPHSSTLKTKVFPSLYSRACSRAILLQSIPLFVILSHSLSLIRVVFHSLILFLRFGVIFSCNLFIRNLHSRSVASSKYLSSIVPPLVE